MRKQAGFAFFQVMIIVSMVAALIFVRVLEQHDEATDANAMRIATLVTPTIIAYAEFSIDNLDVEFNSKEFYKKYHALTEGYANDLKEVGYNYEEDGITAVSHRTETSETVEV